MDDPRSFGALKAAAERAAAAAAGGALRLAGTWQHKGLAPGGDALAKIGAHVRAALGAAFGEGGGASRGAGGVGASHAIVLEDDLEARGPRVLMARRPSSQAEGGGDGVARRCPMRTPSRRGMAQPHRHRRIRRIPTASRTRQVNRRRRITPRPATADFRRGWRRPASVETSRDDASRETSRDDASRERGPVSQSNDASSRSRVRSTER